MMQSDRAVCYLSPPDRRPADPIMPQADEPLPIDAVRSDIAAALGSSSAAVIVAPPGAGKTTRVPLWLAEAGWLGEQRVLVLEPRRLAARGAAARMAATLGEKVGERVGLRARLVSLIGPKTRIEVITEGVFTRMILDDPTLEGVGAVLFDEFHERSLDADLGLALALDTQKGLRPDLRIVPMSATLDAARVAQLLDAAPVIACEGRTFPVETYYLGRDARARIEDLMVPAIVRALREETGSILAFLPGQGEIRRVAERLAERLADRPWPDAGIDIAELYGALDMGEQDRAVLPAPPGRRKVVLATSIAETSLTIEGVRVVIDSGYSRVPRFDPQSGLTRLETVRVSRASADQRRGRAGRTEPGVCYRLWAEPETQSLLAHSEPEIRNADLSGLLLDCATWGVTDPTALSWLDPPPASAIAAARADLVAAGALRADGQLSETGRRAAQLPLPPRLGVMLLRAAGVGEALLAGEIAAVLVERGLGGRDTDLAVRLAAFRADRSRRAEGMRRLARQWAALAVKATADAPSRSPLTPAAVLAFAFPERIAEARDGRGQYVLANGRGARLEETDPLSRAEFLVAGELTGTAASGRIMLAASFEAGELDAIAGDRIETAEELAFDQAAGQVRGRRVRRLGAITLASEPRKVEPGDAAGQILLQGLVDRGLERLPWSRGQDSVRERVGFLRTLAPDDWPDLSFEALALDANDWLLPFLAGKTAAAQVSAEDLGFALDMLLPAGLRRRLDQEAPSHFEAPTGNRHPIHYGGAHAPMVSIRVQELFGIAVHPVVGRPARPLTFELLSPAHRPIQTTRDLPGFWRGSWADVRSEMRGRYPKHSWPDDPAQALPMAGTRDRR